MSLYFVNSTIHENEVVTCALWLQCCFPCAFRRQAAYASKAAYAGVYRAHAGGPGRLTEPSPPWHVDMRHISISDRLDLKCPLGEYPVGPTCARHDHPSVSSSRGMHAESQSQGDGIPHPGTRVTRQGDPRQSDIQHAPMTRHSLVTPSGGHAVHSHLRSFCSIQPLAG